MRTILITIVLAISRLLIAQNTAIDQYIEQGRNHFEQGDYEKAIKNFNQGIAFANNSTLELAETYYSIGRIYADYSMSGIALGNYYHAIKECKEKKGSKKLEQEIYNHIGGLYFNNLYYVDAKKHWNKSLDINKEIGNSLGVSNNLNNIGEVDAKSGNFHEALSLFYEAKILKTAIQDTSGLITVLTNISNAYLDLKYFDSVAYYLDQAFELGYHNGSEQHLQYLYKIQGNFDLAMQKTDLAKRNFLKVLEIDARRKNPDISLRKEIYQSLIDLYKQSGNTDSAYLYYEALNKLESSLFEYEKNHIKKSSEVNALITQKEKELEELNLKVSNNRIKFLFVVFVLVLIISVILFLEFHKKKKARERHELLKKEENLIKLKSHFISRASHEFRTPLSIIQSNMGIIEMIIGDLDESVEAKITKSHNRIKENIQKITDLMDELLLIENFGKNEVGLDLQETELLDVCNRVIDRFKIKNPEYQIDIEIIGTPRKALVNEKMIVRSVRNLVKNAIAFSDAQNRITIRIEYYQNSFKIVVFNQGVVIPEEELKHLDEPFYRGKNAEGKAGVGLGLTIVKEFTAMHNGVLEIRSTNDGGTEFTMGFPN